MFHVNTIIGSGIITTFSYKGTDDWSELERPNSAEMSLLKFYWMLRNARVTAFAVSELLMEN